MLLVSVVVVCATGCAEDVADAFGKALGESLERSLPRSYSTAVEFSADNGTFARSLLVAGQVDFWRHNTGTITKLSPTHLRAAIFALKRQPDGRWLTASSDGDKLASGVLRIDRWDAGMTSRTAVSELKVGERLKPELLGFRAAFSPDCETVVTVSSQELVFWDLQTGDRRATIESLGEVHAMAFDAGGRTLATASDQLQLWDTQTGQSSRRLERLSSPVHAMAFSPDASSLVAGGRELLFWDLKTGLVTPASAEVTGKISAIAFSGDGATVATDGTELALWDFANQTKVAILRTTPSGAVTFLSFLGSEQVLASVFWIDDDSDGVTFWDLTTLRRIPVQHE